MKPEGSLLPQLTTLTRPVLVAHGMRDMRTPAYYAFSAAQALSRGRLLIYPELGHGFLFEQNALVASDFVRFLDGDA